MSALFVLSFSTFPNAFKLFPLDRYGLLTYSLGLFPDFSRPTISTLIGSFPLFPDHSWYYFPSRFPDIFSRQFLKQFLVTFPVTSSRHNFRHVSRHISRHVFPSLLQWILVSSATRFLPLRIDLRVASPLLHVPNLVHFPIQHHTSQHAHDNTDRHDNTGRRKVIRPSSNFMRRVYVAVNDLFIDTRRSFDSFVRGVSNSAYRAGGQRLCRFFGLTEYDVFDGGLAFDDVDFHGSGAVGGRRGDDVASG